MGIWQKITSKVKSWLGGGKKKKKEPPQPRIVNNNPQARNQTVSSRTASGAGSTFNKRELVKSLNAQKKEEDRVKQAFKAKSTEYKSITDSTKATKRPEKSAYKRMAEANAKSKEELRNTLKSYKQERESFNKETNNKYNTKTGDEAHDRKAYALRHGGYGSASPEIQKHSVKYHPVITSAARGAASGATFGATELAISSQAKKDKERAEAEKYYQEHKNAKAEMAGEIVGSLASFGKTAAATDRLGERAIEKVAPKAAEKLAGTKLVQNAAKKSVEKAVKKGIVKEASEELIRQVGTDKAKKIVRAVGTDVIQNATTGLLYDFNKASAEYEIGSPEWWKEMGKSAAFNAAITGVVAGGSTLTGGKQLVKDAADRGTKVLGRIDAEKAIPPKGVVEFPPRNESAIDVTNPDLAKRGKTVEIGAADEGIDVINPNLESRKPRPEAETKVEPPKTKTLKDRIADADDFDEFVKANTKDAEAKEYVKANKMSGLKGLWHEQRIAKHKKGIHKISIEEANEATRKAIPENVLDGWFRSANSGYKPRLVDAIAKDPDAINAGMNVAYHNYVNANPESPLPFDEWLNTPQKMYRGTHGQSVIDEDVFSAFTPDRNVAEKHAGKSGNARIEEIEVKPIDTLGSYQTTVEQEFLVPKSVVEANTPKAEAPTAEVEAEPPKAKSKKKKTPPTREERLANSNGIDQYNARAEHQAQRFEEGYEKADNIRAALAGEEPKAPAKGTKPAAENLNAKAQAETKNINLDDAVNKKREKKKFREQFHDFASSVKTKVSDSLNAFEEENKKFIRSDHQKWLENVGAIDKTRRSGAIASRSIGEAQVKWNGDVFEDGKSLKAIYDGMDEATEKDFDKYLLLKHAPDRIREGKPIFAGTQYDSVEACEKAAKELLDKHPEFAERAEELYRYTRNELQNRVDAGLIKQDVVDEWRKKYPNYVPTGRDGDFGGEHDIWDLAAQLKNNGNTIGAGEIKKAVGGDQPIRSIKEQLADATNRNWRDMSMNNLFRKMFGDKVADELASEADGGLEKVLDNTINLSKTKDGGKYFAEVFVDGDMKRVEVEKRFYDAIEDLYKNGRFGNGIDVLTDAASKVAHPFKNLVTSWNPIFMVKNGLRDFPEAVINSRQTKEFLQIMAQGDALRELKNDGEFLQAFRNSGVSQANFVNLEEALTKGDNWLKKGVNKFATLQEMVETYPRLIEYMATIKKMMPAGYTFKDGMKNVPPEIRDIAAANAADVTVNFGRSGSVGKMLNRGLVPFFNPSVQGWSKFLRNYSEQSGIKSTLELVLKAAAIGTGATAINNFLLEDNPNYQQISARDKATNYIIPVTWGKDVTADNTTLFIKIPKSRFAAAYSLPAVNIGNENKMGWAEMIKVAGDQVAPVDPSESHILAPLLDATKSKQGETWYGTPIVPQSLVGLPKSEQYDVNTSWFGKTLGKATSGLPEELQISPKKADYIIDAETGVIGDLLLPASTPSKQGSGNWAERHIAHPMGNVLKKSFTIDSTTQNNLSTRFYDQLDKASTKNQSSKAGEAESEEYKRLNSYSTEISNLNKTIRDVQGSKRKTKIEDVRGLQEVRNQLMQDAINGNDTPNSAKTLNTVQKYAGTTYAINNFGSSADKKAMKLYGMAKYGDISKQDMRKAINDDRDFFKGVKSIGDLDAKMEKAGIKSNTTLSKAVALASSEANDELFGAYEATKKSRTESDNKMNRARTYFKDGGSEDEYVKLETARKTMGKLTDFDETAEIEKAEKQLAKGEISLAEYHEKEDFIKYNANISYIGLATSLAQANSPERGYRLYDVKDKNIQKGINLAAMGFTARDYREMAKALDTDGNGYPSSKEIRAYVTNSNVKDKATLYDALYYYQGKYNPFGTPTNYTRAQAAAMGSSNGIKSISDDREDFDLNAKSSGSGYKGYSGYRRRYGGYRRYGGGSKAKAPAIKQSAFKADKQTYKDIASSLKTRGSTSSIPDSVVKITPPKVKFKKYEV